MRSYPVAHAQDNIERFVRALFVGAETEDFVALRIFHQFDRSTPPLHVEGVRVGDFVRLSERASAVAERAATLTVPAVFAVPLATFTRPDKARAQDIHEGLTLSVEADAAPDKARTTLEHLLGPCTCIVASGSEWVDEKTGEVIPCLHLHWRLAEPADEPAAHLLLAQARRCAALRVGADLSGAPITHPYRWPGSWNRKRAKPVLARICCIRPDAEIDLEAAAEKLQIEAPPLADAHEGSVVGQGAEAHRIAEAVAATPNAASYGEWIRYGYALHNAVGAELGRHLFIAWSMKNRKFDMGETDVTWARIGNARPGRVGAGTIFHLRAVHGRSDEG